MIYLPSSSVTCEVESPTAKPLWAAHGSGGGDYGEVVSIKESILDDIMADILSSIVYRRCPGEID